MSKSNWMPRKGGGANEPELLLELATIEAVNFLYRGGAAPTVTRSGKSVTVTSTFGTWTGQAKVWAASLADALADVE